MNYPEKAKDWEGILCSSKYEFNDFPKGTKFIVLKKRKVKNQKLLTLINVPDFGDERVERIHKVPASFVRLLRKATEDEWMKVSAWLYARILLKEKENEIMDKEE